MELLELFDNDEKKAWEYACVLDKYDLVGFIGEVEGEYLPMAFERSPKVGLFIENGGFVGLYNKRVGKTI